MGRPQSASPLRSTGRSDGGPKVVEGSWSPKGGGSALRAGSVPPAIARSPERSPSISRNWLHGRVMGWPIDLGVHGYGRWQSDLNAISRCGNTCVSISAVECIFGMNWNEEQLKPWIMSLVEMFGPKRCMFGSHMPIDALSHGFDRLYDTYERILSVFSSDECDDMFRGTALNWFRVPRR